MVVEHIGRQAVASHKLIGKRRDHASSPYPLYLHSKRRIARQLVGIWIDG